MPACLALTFAILSRWAASTKNGKFPPVFDEEDNSVSDTKKTAGFMPVDRYLA